MCVEIVMMILMMMISAKEKRYTTCVGAHKVTKRGTQRKKSLFLVPSPTRNHQQSAKNGGDQKKNVGKKKGKKRKGNIHRPPRLG